MTIVTDRKVFLLPTNTGRFTLNPPSVTRDWQS
jgi:hypothetical protein